MTKPGPILSVILLLSVMIAACSNGACPHEAGRQTASVANQQADAVVEITAKDQAGKSFARGSGFLVRSDGVLVTNEHIIDGAASASVELSNGDTFDDVVLLDSDKRRDLVILKVKALNTPTSKLGDSDLLVVGQHVIAIGNPEGLTRSVSDGIVSAIRQHEGIGGKVIQTTAPISPGSSGGLLLNDSGEVIGVTAFGALEGQNLNLAVPINYVKPMLLDLDRQPRQTLAAFNQGHLKNAPEEPNPPSQSNETASPSGPTPPAASETPSPSGPTPPAASETPSPSGPTPPPKVEITKPIDEYLEAMLGKWSPDDAEKTLGHPSTHRFAYDNNRTVDGDIYAYDDPTRFAHQIELNFDGKTNRLREIYLYPSAHMTWKDCKKLWGDNVQKTRDRDGAKLYAYRDRRLGVALTKDDVVVYLGRYLRSIATK
jgi:S1-C subfamily serine protease